MPEVNKLFEVHLLNNQGIRKAAAIAMAFDDLLSELSLHCPESREFSIVKTKLEEAAFFAKKAMSVQAENQREEVNMPREKCYFCDEEDDVENLIEHRLGDGSTVKAHENCAELQEESKQEEDDEESSEDDE